MNKLFIIISILFACLTSGKLVAQHPFSDKVIEGRMPYTKGEVKQEIRFVNSPGLEKYSVAEPYWPTGSTTTIRKVLKQKSLHF